MLKFEGIAFGTTIKAYDFEPAPGRTARYIIGRIIDTAVVHGAKVYVISCSEDSAFPEDNNRVDELVYVPMETTMDFHNRVVPLDGPCA